MISMGVLEAVKESRCEYGCESELMLSLNVVHVASKTVTPFLYMYSNGKLDEQNIFNLEQALFCQKHRVSIKQISLKV
jgi:hypothetical protein